MQPILHISTAFAYFELPSNISGALYHLVATYSVLTASFSPSYIAKDLAKPKSANFTKHSLFNRIFEGFKSRCIISPECIYLIPLSI